MALLVLILGINVWAAEPSKSLDVIDPVWGKFTIRVENAGKPSTDPIRVNLTLLCKDQRTSPNAVSPTPSEVMAPEKICAFDKYIFDKEHKVLTLQVTTSEKVGEEPLCQKHMKRDFDMTKLCANWTSRAAKK